MVTTRFQEYLQAFRFSWALCAGLEIPALVLSDKASEVAFGLSERWQRAAVPAIQKGKPENDEDEEEQAHLPWEIPQISLDQALAKCLKKVSEGEKFPARSLLEDVPIYEGLKSKAEENNHGQDGRSQQDK